MLFLQYVFTLTMRENDNYELRQLIWCSSYEFKNKKWFNLELSIFVKILPLKVEHFLCFEASF
jgi:hypothetical protein